MPPAPPRLISVSPRAEADSFVGDEALEDALRAGRGWAEREALARFTTPVRRILARVLGTTADLEDLTQEVFLRGLGRIRRLRAGVGLQAWFTGFAVYVAREALRARARKHWLVLRAPDALADASEAYAVSGAAVDAGADAHRALQATYEVLGQLGDGPRAIFALRRLEGMDVAELAKVLRVSPATVKRRYARAEKLFLSRAQHHPWLAGWLAQLDEDAGRARESSS